MPYSTLLLGRAGNIATVTINRPDKLNALNAACKEELLALLGTLRTDTAVRAVVITGAGPKAFMAGTDITELSGLDPASGKEFALGGRRSSTRSTSGKPVIAAVNRYARRGCELASPATFIASETAVFGQPEVNLGIIPGYGGNSARADRQARPRREMILTGRSVDAREALGMGLVSSVVPAAELLQAAGALAAAAAGKGLLAVRMALKALNAVFELPLSEGLRVEAGLFGELCGTADFREGTAAFLEKRKPNFTGK